MAFRLGVVGMVEGEGGQERSYLGFLLSDIVTAVLVLPAAEPPIRHSVLLGVIRL